MKVETKITDEQKKEIRRKWKTLSNDQLLKHLIENFGYTGCKTTVRTFMYKNGMKKTNCLRWTPKETEYLLNNYKTKGNIEIATKLSTKKRPVTKKNVEKKMKLLKISPTIEEKLKIIQNHQKKGTYSKANYKRWEELKIKEGDKTISVVCGRPTYLIKVNNILIPYARHRYIELNGPIEKGMRVHYKDCNPLNVSDENLEIRKGCSYSKEERLKYNRFCREYVINNKMKDKLQKSVPTSPIKNKPEVTKGLVTLRINEKTVIQVRPGTNIEHIKEKYGIARMLSNAKTLNI